MRFKQLLFVGLVNLFIVSPGWSAEEQSLSADQPSVTLHQAVKDGDVEKVQEIGRAW